jgi:hypothetical protein
VDAAIIQTILDEEMQHGLQALDVYLGFQGKADAVKDGLLRFLIEEKRSDRKIAAYGAAAKGNTLLNYAGVKPDLLPFVCDAAASKQGRYLPGSHIPVVSPSALAELKPDLLLILPWNIADEIVDQLAYIRAWGGQFVVVVPEISILK